MLLWHKSFQMHLAVSDETKLCHAVFDSDRSRIAVMESCPVMYVTGEWLAFLIHNEAPTRAALQMFDMRNPALIVRQYSCSICEYATYLNEIWYWSSGECSFGLDWLIYNPYWKVALNFTDFLQELSSCRNRSN
jgi:hypothetical protein